MYPKNSKKTRKFYWEDIIDIRFIISDVPGSELSIFGFENNFEILKFRMSKYDADELERILSYSKLNDVVKLNKEHILSINFQEVVFYIDGMKFNSYCRNLFIFD